MLSKFRAAGLLWPTLFALAALAMLLSLGTWQMNRKAWKDGLQQQIVERTRAAPVELTPAVAARDFEYLRVKVQGRFLHTQTRNLYWPLSGQLGSLIYTPMVLDDGMIVLVNRGWVPDGLTDAQLRLPSGPIELTGLLRAPEIPNRFTPQNTPSANQWYWRDVASMLACQGQPVEPDCKALKGRAYPFSIDAEAGAEGSGFPRGGTTSLNLPNKHLEYAVTWYGLALTLIGVYAAFAWGRLRGAR
jgi:surfeit locus 1 family protein